tara:strand:+ start:333 stop:2102 length:1770 start_codon:yes stop_codon:yes gene_type:complete
MNLDNHPATTDEIRALCADLGVLGKVDFKNLLKWRLAIRKSRKLDGKRKAALRGGLALTGGEIDDSDSDDDVKDMDADTADDTNKSTEDSKLMEEMEELQQSADARTRRDKKKKAKLRAKERMRTALGLVGQDEEGATGASEMDLFSLARIKSKGGLDAVQNQQAPGLDAARDSDDDINEFEERRGVRGKYDDSSDDDDAEGGGNTRLEAELDSMWREYKARQTKKGTTFSEKQGGRDTRVAIGAGEINSDDDDDEIDQAGAAMKRAGQRALAEALAEASPGNPLLYNAGTKGDTEIEKPVVKGPAAATNWFANDLFGKTAPEVGSKVQAKSEAKAEAKKKKVAEEIAAAGWKKATDEADDDSADDSDASGFDEDDDYFAEGEEGGEDEEEEEDATDGDDESEEPVKQTKSKKRKEAGSDSDEDDYDALRHASAVKKKRDEEKEAKAKAKAEKVEMAKASALKRQKQSPGGKKTPAYDDTYDDDTDSSEDDGGAGLSGNDPTGTKTSRARAGKDNQHFLEAPAEYEADSASSDSDSDSDPDDISDDEKAEILAIGKNMIRKKDRVRAIIFFGFDRFFTVSFLPVCAFRV